MADRDTTIRILVETASGVKAVKALGSEMGTVAGGITRQMPAAEKSIGRIEPAARKAAGGVERVGDVAGGASRQMRALGDVGETALGRMGRAGDLALGVFAGGVAVAATNAVLDIGGAAFTVAADFEQAGADLSAITGVMGSDLRALEGTAIEASIRTGQSAGAQIEAYKLIASNMDVTTEQLQTMGEEIVTLAVAAGVDLPRAADAATNTLNQFGLEATETARVVNVLAAGAKEGAAEVPDLADAMREAGTTAAGANVSLEATVGALEVLAQNAQKGSQAGTGLRNVITILQTETSKLADAGIRGVNVEGDGLVATLQKLTPLLSNAGALTDIFGRENLNAARILIANAGAVDTMTDAVTGTTVAQEQAAIQADTLRGDLDKLRTAFEALMLEGSGFNESLRSLVQTGRDVLVWLHEHWDAVSLAAKITTIATVAVIAFRAEAALSARATALMAGAVTLMGNAQAANATRTSLATAALTAFNVAIRANPIGLILGAVGAVATAMLLFRDNANEATAALAQQEVQADQTAEALGRVTRMADAELAARVRLATTSVAQLETLVTSLDRQIADGRREMLDITGRGAAERIRDLRETIRGLEADRTGIAAELASARAAEAVINAADASRQSTTEPRPAAASPRSAGSGSGSSTRSGTDSAEEHRRQAAQDAEDMKRYGEVIVTAKREQAERMTAHERAMHEASLREAHQTMAATLALVEDEYARRHQLLDNDGRLATEVRTSRLAGIEEERDAAVAAAEEAYRAEVARIDRLRPAKARSAAEQAAVDAAAEERTAARLSADLDAEEARVAAEEDSAETRARLSEERRRLAAEEADAQIAEWGREADAYDAMMERRHEDERALKQQRAEAHAEQMQQLQEVADATLQGVGLAMQLYQGMHARRVQQMDAERARETNGRERAQAAELAAIDAQLGAETLSADERARLQDEQQALQERHRVANENADLRWRQKSAEMDREAAGAERRATLFQIAIQTALNVVEAFPNLFKMGAAVVLGGAQTAAVLAQPLPPIPQYALGTDASPAGFALVGERGPEIVNLPGGSSVITNERAERLGAAMQALRSYGAGRSAAGAQPDARLHQLVEQHAQATLTQTAALAEGLADVRAAVERIDLVIDDLSLARRLGRVADREAAVGNNRPR